MQVDSLRAQQGLHTFTGSARGSFFNSLGLFVMGDHCAEAHGACPLPLSLLLITCSAEKKVDRTEICIEEKKKICYASACVDSCTTPGKTTALALATECGSSRTPALTSFLFSPFFK
jgi:hypothetical protein